uniref:AlNc14C343G10827 protein n=1 Tax=Albugo laibachii Nc14 TaxID=890382 RepID=F0WX69_9STRA|nr:AlNc14C343G10827 [Albugo laibachii Nc14]|eukprot:CCA26060.1 AlNc14C343G10827 [Albugo laibachii Nc14]
MKWKSYGSDVPPSGLFDTLIQTYKITSTIAKSHYLYIQGENELRRVEIKRKFKPTKHRRNCKCLLQHAEQIFSELSTATTIKSASSSFWQSSECDLANLPP